jgi:hypothetical protein
MAHTPGPWQALSTEIVSTARPDHDCVVADVLSEDYEADARLIAAAPELLHGLKAAVASIVELAQYEEAARDMAATGWFDDAVKAIAKAEGRTDEE